MILPENGNKARQEHSSLIVHADNSNVEFFNDTPQIIRIQDRGSGIIGEEYTLSWVGPEIPITTNAKIIRIKKSYAKIN